MLQTTSPSLQSQTNKFTVPSTGTMRAILERPICDMDTKEEQRGAKSIKRFFLAGILWGEPSRRSRRQMFMELPNVRLILCGEPCWEVLKTHSGLCLTTARRLSGE